MKIIPFLYDFMTCEWRRTTRFRYFWSSLSQGSSESQQSSFPYDLPDLLREGGGNDPYDRDDYMDTRLNTAFSQALGPDW